MFNSLFVFQRIYTLCIYHIRETEGPCCPCDGTSRQTGTYITFDCPLHQTQRTRLLQGKSTWDELDTPTLIRVDINEYEDGVIIFFAYIFDYLT